MLSIRGLGRARPVDPYHPSFVAVHVSPATAISAAMEGVSEDHHTPSQSASSELDDEAGGKVDGRTHSPTNHNSELILLRQFSALQLDKEPSDHDEELPSPDDFAAGPPGGGGGPPCGGGGTTGGPPGGAGPPGGGGPPGGPSGVGRTDVNVEPEEMAVDSSPPVEDKMLPHFSLHDGGTIFPSAVEGTTHAGAAPPASFSHARPAALGLVVSKNDREESFSRNSSGNYKSPVFLPKLQKTNAGGRRQPVQRSLSARFPEQERAGTRSSPRAASEDSPRKFARDTSSVTTTFPTVTDPIVTTTPIAAAAPPSIPPPAEERAMRPSPVSANDDERRPSWAPRLACYEEYIEGLKRRDSQTQERYVRPSSGQTRSRHCPEEEPL